MADGLDQEDIVKAAGAVVGVIALLLIIIGFIQGPTFGPLTDTGIIMGILALIIFWFARRSSTSP